MSSIYRKGRDGYFYYQTYIRNKKLARKTSEYFILLEQKIRSKLKKKSNNLIKNMQILHTIMKIQGGSTI